MSTIKSNNVQIGQSTTATNNFVISVPSTPDGTMKIARGNAGATTQDVLSVNSSGKVGIGTSTILSKFRVVGSDTVSSQANVAAIVGAGVTSDLLLGSTNGNAPFVASQGAYPLSFWTNGAERMRIDSSGVASFYVELIANNIVSSGGTLTARGGASEGGQIVLGYGGGAATTITGQTNNTWNIDVDPNNLLRIFRVNSSGTAMTALTVAEATGDATFVGAVSAVDFNSTSDINLKENIAPVDGQSILNEINPVQFTWKESGKKSYGVIAQEIEKILPELVVEREDGMKGVSYIPIIAMLVDAVKKLDARVQQLENK